VKCFWCRRKAEEGSLHYAHIKDAEYIYEGKSVCAEDLDTIRRVGARTMLEEAALAARRKS